MLGEPTNVSRYCSVALFASRFVTKRGYRIISCGIGGSSVVRDGRRGAIRGWSSTNSILAATYVLCSTPRVGGRRGVPDSSDAAPHREGTLAALVASGFPRKRGIWEATRFGCNRNVKPNTVPTDHNELTCSRRESGIATKYQSILVSCRAILRHFIAAAGAAMLLSSPKCTHHDLATAYIDVSQKKCWRCENRR
jgi:hypothetical protein